MPEKVVVTLVEKVADAVLLTETLGVTVVVVEAVNVLL